MPPSHPSQPQGPYGPNNPAPPPPGPPPPSNAAGYTQSEDAHVPNWQKYQHLPEWKRKRSRSSRSVKEKRAIRRQEWIQRRDARNAQKEQIGMREESPLKWDDDEDEDEREGSNSVSGYRPGANSGVSFVGGQNANENRFQQRHSENNQKRSLDEDPSARYVSPATRADPGIGSDDEVDWGDDDDEHYLPPETQSRPPIPTKPFLDPVIRNPYISGQKRPDSHDGGSFELPATSRGPAHDIMAQPRSREPSFRAYPSMEKTQTDDHRHKRPRHGSHNHAHQYPEPGPRYNKQQSPTIPRSESYPKNHKHTPVQSWRDEPIPEPPRPDTVYNLQEYDKHITELHKRLPRHERYLNGNGKVGPYVYGSRQGYDLGLCFVTFCTKFRCEMGVRCAWRHHPLTQDERDWIVAIGRERGKQFLEKMTWSIPEVPVPGATMHDK